MIYHVLPGDSLAEEFSNTGIDGEIVVCRECLIVGDVSGETLDEFWERRSNFLMIEYGGDEIEYYETVVGELVKLIELSPETEVNLWFEYELFCQVNMWFCLSLLAASEASVYRVAPVVRSKDEIWKGFGSLHADDLKQSLAARTRFADADLQLGQDLWGAYRLGDYERLSGLGKTESKCFPHVAEVCYAEIQKATRPKQIVDEIMAEGIKEIGELFPKFTHRAGVYGFGDVQVERLMRKN